MTKELTRTFMKEESYKLGFLIKESYSKKKSLKDLFLGKIPGDSNPSSLIAGQSLKDHLI